MGSPDFNLYAELFKTIGMLSIVLGFFAGILYIVKKIGGLKAGSGGKSSIRLISSFYLGNREKLVIVEVETERFLLGLTANNISMLSRLPSPEIVEEKEVIEKKDFSAIFKENLKKTVFQKKERKNNVKEL